MSPDERTEIRNASGLALLLAVAALVVCVCGGCGASAALERAELARINNSLEQIAKGLPQKHEPTPAPIDYSPQLNSIAESLKAIAAKEHSVVVTPPTPKPPCKPKGHK